MYTSLDSSSESFQQLQIQGGHYRSPGSRGFQGRVGRRPGIDGGPGRKELAGDYSLPLPGPPGFSLDQRHPPHLHVVAGGQAVELGFRENFLAGIVAESLSP